MSHSATYDFPLNSDNRKTPDKSTHYFSTLKHSSSVGSGVNDQNARLMIHTTYGKPNSTPSVCNINGAATLHSLPKDVKIYSLESTPLPSRNSREVSVPGTSNRKIRNVLDYHSTTTVITTTKTTTAGAVIPAELIQLTASDTLTPEEDVWRHKLHSPYSGCLLNWDRQCNCANASVDSHKPLLLVLPKHDYKPLDRLSVMPASSISDVTADLGTKERDLAPTKSASANKICTGMVEGDRDMWENKTDFLLSVIGFAVDLANVWRFPYLCFKNGGGAFLIPYIIMVILAGIPLFYMELALGQYYRKGAITTWGKICPLFKGIGYCVIMTAFYTDFFYNVIIAFALHYFFASFNTLLPWASCSNSYNSPACYEPSWSSDGDGSSRECAVSPVFINSSALNSSLRAISAAEEYFYKYFLGLHEEKKPIAHVAYGLDNLGGVNWELVVCVFIIYIICYFSLWKGIKMSGKVVWFTAIFPYIVLGVLLIRGVTLPGWEKGIEYYLRPNLEMLKIPSVWQDAATQVFFSLGPGFGVLLAYSSYNEFHNNVYFDALLTSSINCMTSFLAGFVIFSILGYMSCKSGKPIHEVAQEGPGLAFVVYPEALATMPGASLWSIAFFLMLLTLGLDSSFGGSEAIITALSDEFPIIKRNREIFVALLFFFYMVIGLMMCTRGGMLIMEWLIFYGTAWGLLIAVFCETMVISFCYGIKQFSEDIHEMLGFDPGWYWKICWTVAAPSFLIAMIMSSFINYQHLQYQDYIYSDLSNALGLIFALSSASAIPIVGIYTWYKQSGDSCLEKLRLSLIPLKRRDSSTTILESPIAGDIASAIVVDYENRCGNDVFISHPHANDVML